MDDRRLPSRPKRSFGARNLQSATSLVVLIVASSFVPAVLAAGVNVDTTNIRAVMPLEGLGVGTAVYSGQFGYSNLPSRLNEAGITTLRYPGGGYSDVYHWSISQDGPFGNTTDKGYISPGNNFPALLKVMNNMTGGGQAVITVDYGSALKLSGTTTVKPDFGGQPQEAAAWVAYANADPSIYGTASDVVLGVDQQGNNWRTAGYWAKLRASTSSQYFTWASADGVYNSQNSFLAIDRPTPVGIKYWEIGNETFGTGYYGGGNGYSTDYHVPYDGTNRNNNSNLSPAHYGQQVVQYSQLMKAVDPTIKIGAVLSTPPDDYSWDVQSGQHWNNQVLSQPGISSAVDFAIVHWYPYAGDLVTAYTDSNHNSRFDYTDSNSNGRYDIGESSEPITAVNNGSSALSFPGTKIPLMINGQTPGQDFGTSAGVRDSLAQWGLPNAQIMVTEFNVNGRIWTGGGPDPTNYFTAADTEYVADAYATWLDNGVTSVQFLELSAADFLDSTPTLNRSSAFWAVEMLNQAENPGDSAVTATSDTSTVRVHSYKRPDGSVAIMILNESLTAQNISVNINGSLLASTGTLYSTTGTSIATSSVAGLGNAFTVSNMPGRTIYTYVIPRLSIPGDYNNDGVVDAADYTVWRDSVGQAGIGLAADGTGPSGTPDGIVDDLDYQFWVAHFGATSAASGAGSNQAVPEASTFLLVTSGVAFFLIGFGCPIRHLLWRNRAEQ
jgi:Glycosyl hydrolase family 30 beta sandwich domain